MKKIIVLIAISLACTTMVQSQVIPKIQFGLKGGANISKIVDEESFTSESRSGYLAGVWLRVGALGVHLQPELYYTGKKARVKDAAGIESDITFTSIDVPILLGTKIGAFGVGARLNTGPVISFVVDEDQTANDKLNNALRFNYKNQALAWQVGAGFDVSKISIDLRYEKGLSRINREGYQDTRLNLFNISLGLRLY